MNGPHDLGGKHGLGAIAPEVEALEPVFHAEWERRVFALTLATGMLGQWNIDESRYARERQHPVAYLSHSYYENWLAGLETLLAEKHLLPEPKIEDLQIPGPNDAAKIMQRGGPTLLESDKQPGFAVGDRVRLRKLHTPGHSRAPQYAQGAVGVVSAWHGCHIFPDAHVQQNQLGEHLYGVTFSDESLWGHHSDNAVVHIDLWEPYLEAVGAND